MASPTTLAVFRFQIRNRPTTTAIEHSHPVPTFLCTPASSQNDSQLWKDAFIDVISVITGQHHDECMRALNTPCLSCQKPALDCLKTPVSALHLTRPMVTIAVDPVCGSEVCGRRIRSYLGQMQEKEMKEAKEHEARIYGKMDCG